MGNQALVSDLALLLFRPLYTRNFPNRLGQGANFYLASAELAAVASIEGKLPSVDKYIMKYMAKVDSTAADATDQSIFHAASKLASE